jgi:hypothetical protein
MAVVFADEVSPELFIHCFQRRINAEQRLG